MWNKPRPTCTGKVQGGTVSKEWFTYLQILQQFVLIKTVTLILHRAACRGTKGFFFSVFHDFFNTQSAGRADLREVSSTFFWERQKPGHSRLCAWHYVHGKSCVLSAGQDSGSHFNICLTWSLLIKALKRVLSWAGSEITEKAESIFFLGLLWLFCFVFCLNEKMVSVMDLQSELKLRSESRDSCQSVLIGRMRPLPWRGAVREDMVPLEPGWERGKHRSHFWQVLSFEVVWRAVQITHSSTPSYSASLSTGMVLLMKCEAGMNSAEG